MRKLHRKNKRIHGWGINDADYAVTRKENGKVVWQCPYFLKWDRIVARCHSERIKQKYPTYEDCTICDEWQSFMAFRAWMETQDWVGKEPDKDILGDGTHYSPETCCFVERWLNTLFNKRQNARGDYPMGVYYNKRAKKFQAQLQINGETHYLGLYEDSQEAHKVYLIAKHKYVKEKMEDYPDQRIKQAVLDKLEREYPIP